MLISLLISTALAAPIDLTLPLGPQPSTDEYVFDESVSFAPNFAINQNAVELKDLFGPNGSQLCFPSSLAEALIWEQEFSGGVRAPLPGLSGAGIDPFALVRSLNASCKTDPVDGTKPASGLACALIYTDATLIDPFTSGPGIESRDLTIDDLRAALRAHHPVILETGFFEFDETAHSFVRHNGHYVSVYGYNWNRGSDEIQLKVINPLIDYGVIRQTEWTTVTMTRVAVKPGITYPAHRNYTLSGAQFGSLKNRALVGAMLVIGQKSN